MKHLFLSCLDIVKGFDERDSTCVQHSLSDADVTLREDFSIDNVSIGIPKEFAAPDLAPEVTDCWNQVAELLRKNGASVSEVNNVLCCA